jgi:phenylacetic acid degradation operon negative regulatory protein
MPSKVTVHAAALVRSFQRQRPLRAGSLLVTILGDSVMPRGGVVALSGLIRLGAAFGLSERHVRTVSARLALDGWVEARRVGKQSEYQLTADGRARFAEATQRIYALPAKVWSESWTLIVLPAQKASERRRIRHELAWQGFGELVSGVFAHPEKIPADIRPGIDDIGLPASALIFEATMAEHLAHERLVALGWNLNDLALRYQRFVSRFEQTQKILRQETADPETSFIIRTLLIHEYRRLHLRDPQLPASLLPADWPGARAAELCRMIYEAVLAASESFLSKSASRLEEELPRADQSLMTRFGGLNLR